MNAESHCLAFSIMRAIVVVGSVAITSTNDAMCAEPIQMTVRYFVIDLEKKDINGELHESAAHVSESDLRELDLTPEIIRKELSRFFEALEKLIGAAIGKAVVSIFHGEDASKPEIAEANKVIAPIDPRVVKLLARGILVESRVSKNGKLIRFERDVFKFPGPEPKPGGLNGKDVNEPKPRK